jgi:hypothetical protein
MNPLLFNMLVTVQEAETRIAAQDSPIEQPEAEDEVLDVIIDIDVDEEIEMQREPSLPATPARPQGKNLFLFCN